MKTKELTEDVKELLQKLDLYMYMSAASKSISLGYYPLYPYHKQLERYNLPFYKRRFTKFPVYHGKPIDITHYVITGQRKYINNHLTTTPTSLYHN